MASFFEKLKKGMGIEDLEEAESQEQTPEEKPIPKKAELKSKDKNSKSPAKNKVVPKKIKIESMVIEPEVKQPVRPEKEELRKQEVPKSEPKKEVAAENNNRGFNLQHLTPEEEEGQLAVDVYQTDNELVIQSTIAGVKPEDLDISIEADTVVIRGSRIQASEPGEKNYFYQECYWGPFSRQIIIPEETDPSRAEAQMKEGVLTIRIPRVERNKKRKIAVKG